jgi:restriction endonuclease S subunit
MSKSSLLNGWRVVKFGELAESITERVEDPKAAGVEIYVGLEHLDSATTKISRYGTPEDVESTKLRFFPGDVIYARRRAYQRKLGVAEVEGICSAHALVLRARPEVCLPEFLPYFLQSDQFHDRALSISVGSLSPTINWKTLVVQEFVLPPIAEQHRIIAIMGAVSHVQSKSLEALTVAEKQLSNVCIRLTMTTETDSRNIEEVADILDSQRIPINDAERSLRVGDVPYYGSNGQVGWIDKPLFSEPLTLVAEDGGYFSDWRNAPIAYRIDGPSWVNNHAHVLRATKVPAGWLYFSLRNRDLTKIIVGTTRTKLNRKALSNLAIEVPNDLDKRLEILETFETVVNSMTTKVSAEKLLNKNLLNQLLTGEIL